MQAFLKKNNILLWSILVFVIAFSIRVYYISHRAGTHIDEMVTATVTECKYNKDLFFNPKQGITYSGKELKNLIIPKQQKFNESLFALKMLRENNCGDYSQPSLYYTTFKLFTLPAEKFDFKTLVSYGCALNLIFFGFSFILMYKILKRLFSEQPFVIPLGLAAAFLNTGSITITLLVRMYELQTLAAIFISYASISIYKNILESKNVLSIKDWLLYFLSSIICINSGYFMGIYYAFITLFLQLKSIKDKQYKITLYIFIIFLLTILASWIVYPGYLNGLLHERATEVYAALNHPENINNLINSILSLISHFRFFMYYFPVLLILLGCILIERNDLKVNRGFLTLYLISIFWALFIAIISPIKVFRYIYPVFPILSLIIPYIVSYLKGFKKYLISILIIFVYIFYALSPKSVEWSDYFTEINGYKYYNPSYDLFSSHIENLNLKQPEFTKHPDIPVILMVNAPWQYSNLFYYLNDEQKYEYYYLPYDKNRDFNKLTEEGFDKYLKKYDYFYLITTYTMQEPKNWKSVWKKEYRNGYPSINVQPSSPIYPAVKSIESFGIIEIYLMDFR